MKRIYTSLDIGSDTIKVIVAELYKGKLNLLAAKTVKSEGIKKGLIVDANLAAGSIKKALEEVSRMLGIFIDKVIVNVPSYLAEFSVVTSEVNISKDFVEGIDISSVMDKAYSNYHNANLEILTILPIDFKVDNKIVLDPKGLPGSILKMRGVLVTLPSKNIYSVINLIEAIGVKVVDVSLSGISDYYALKKDNMSSKAGLIINMGSETTTISLYNKGIIVKNSVVQFGSSDVTSDIAYIYKLSINDARQLKENFALAHHKFANSSEVYEIINSLSENISINQVEVSEIVNSRVEQILNFVKNDVNSLANHEIDYIILTGGASNLPYMVDVTEGVLGRKCSLGNINTIGVRSNKYSTCLGSIYYFVQKLKLQGKGYTMVEDDDSSDLASPRKNSVNEKNIIKALIGFFDE
ncbi:MAG: cell division protein FtsA [Bacilli bacterium]|nr:cell division protein FtsA [Bacilli bacterium]